MVELQHRTHHPNELTQFVLTHPQAEVRDFDSLAFQPVKRVVKTALNQDQGGLCAYCEKFLTHDSGQIDHIRPKGGANAHPDLCFVYTNYAHSCINDKTCGQKKKNGLLPFAPGPNCNSEWTLSTVGTIEPLSDLSRHQKHQVRQTCDMLGLNADANLVDERQKWLTQLVLVMQQAPDDIHEYLKESPFRYMLATVV